MKQYEEKLGRAQETLRTAAEVNQFYKKPLIITDSGGKDSTVLKYVAEQCLEPWEWEIVHNVTTMDASVTMQFIRQERLRYRAKGIPYTLRKPLYKGTPTTIWKEIVRQGTPPTRLNRYCCRIFKEANTPNRLIVTGVRADESTGRSLRKAFELRGKTKKDAKRYTEEHVKSVLDDALRVSEELQLGIEQETAYDCTFIRSAKQKKDAICNPLLDFTESDIWNVIRDKGLPVNPVYDEQKCFRCGCVGCPQAGRRQRLEQFQYNPEFKVRFVKAFDAMLERGREKGKQYSWKTGKDVFDWWLEDDAFPGQMTLF